MSYVGQGPGLKTTNIKRFDVTSSTSATHVLSWTAVSEQTLIITINGVKQQDDAYTIAGSPTTITLSSALVAADKMEVIGIVDMGVSTYPVDGSVSTASLGNTSVTTAKIAADAVGTTEIAANAVDTSEIAANAVTLAEMAGLARGKIIVGDASGDPSALTVGTSGQYLTSDGSDASWGAVVSLPTQTDKDGYTLITDGTNASWALRPGRNIFINGACQVNQRGNATGQTGSAYHSVDRFYTAISAIGTYSFSKATVGPAGFGNCWEITCTTADASPAAGDLLVLQCKFEGQNLQQLKKGTASAESLTLSFWVRSFQTGNYQVNLIDNDNSRVIGTTFTINTSATWEYKTMTFAGDTTGALGNDINTSLYIEWWFDSGTDFSSGAVPTSWEAKVNADRNAGGTINLADSTSNYFQMTGIQLEMGTVATPFEWNSYSTTLNDCQRYYYEQWKTMAGYASNGVVGWEHPVHMRDVPTFTWEYGHNGTASNVYRIDSGAQNAMTSSNTQFIYTTGLDHWYNTNGSYALWAGPSYGTAVKTYIYMDAEL